MSDRTVHAVCADGREIVRYDRAGKWWIEHTTGRVRLSVQSAAEIAAVTTRLGGEVFFGRPGGTAFDKRVRDYLATRSDRGHANIDPENEEDVRRLALEYEKRRGPGNHMMQDALREFADPKPPKCKSALIVKGEHFACDQSDGHGMSHANQAAGAIWGEGE